MRRSTPRRRPSRPAPRAAAALAVGAALAWAAAGSAADGAIEAAMDAAPASSPGVRALDPAPAAGAGARTSASVRASIHAPAPAPLVEGHLLTRRWLYIQANFQVPETAPRLEALLDRARTAGFNGAVLADVKFGRLEDGSLLPVYYDNLSRVLRHAVGLGMIVRPSTADFGYSSSILWHDPNLAEGLPVRGAPYRAAGGVLVADERPPVTLVNGDFETLPASGHAFPGWAFQDAPGTATFVDTVVRHGGRASLRMDDLAATNPASGNGRVYQRLAVEPFRQYHLRVWVRTAGFAGGDVRLNVLAHDPDRTLQWNPVPVAATQDWTPFDVTINTLTHREILVYLGVWGGGRGSIWWDDASIEPAGPVNLVRRPGAPLALTDDTGAVVYEEGRDVLPILDPSMGSVPWPGSYDLWHPPPAIRLAPSSRIAEGQRVRLSYYHTALIYGDQVAASLLEPGSLAVVDGQLAALRRAFDAAGAFSGWHLAHDEIRVHGWDEAPRAGAGTPGENLAENVRRVRAAARALDPAAELSIWSDMFDPTHNAAAGAPYYLVNGDWSGAWEGLDPDITVLNWHHFARDRRAAAEFFAARGHRQVLAGYYDRAPSAFVDRAWLAELAGVPGIDGVMYTPWSTGYDRLEAWAEHVWGDAEWLAPPAATPTASATAVATASPAATVGARGSATPAAGPSGTPGAATPGPPVAAAYLPWARSARSP